MQNPTALAASKQSKASITLLLVALLVTPSLGHGRLQLPVTRKQVVNGYDSYENDPSPVDSVKFVCRNDPPKAGGKLRDVPAGNHVEVGGTMDVKWDFSADHVGDCSMYVSYDFREEGQNMKKMTWFKIANWNDCKKDETKVMKMDIPDWLPAGRAVFRWDWYALHQWVAGNVEHYNQCADVQVKGGAKSLQANQIPQYSVLGLYPTDVKTRFRQAIGVKPVPMWMTGPPCACRASKLNSCGLTKSASVTKMGFVSRDTITKDVLPACEGGEPKDEDEKPVDSESESSESEESDENVQIQHGSEKLAAVLKAYGAKIDSGALFSMAGNGKGSCPETAPYLCKNFYTFESFGKAVEMYNKKQSGNKKFLSGTVNEAAKTLLAFMANVKAETAQWKACKERLQDGGSPSCPAVREGLQGGCSGGKIGDYTSKLSKAAQFQVTTCKGATSPAKGCTTIWGKKIESENCWFGRGAIQLSWPGNYDGFRDIIFNAGGVDICENPDLICESQETAWLTAIAFWKSKDGVWKKTFNFEAAIKIPDPADKASNPARRADYSQWLSKLGVPAVDPVDDDSSSDDSSDDSNDEQPVCARRWKKCGGAGWQGATCCEAGFKCSAQSKWYSQCVEKEVVAVEAPKDPVIVKPKPGDGQDCVVPWGKCGGKNWDGPTCCKTGFRCAKMSEWYSQCVP